MQNLFLILKTGKLPAIFGSILKQITSLRNKGAWSILLTITLIYSVFKNKKAERKSEFEKKIIEVCFLQKWTDKLYFSNCIANSIMIRLLSLSFQFSTIFLCQNLTYGIHLIMFLGTAC